MGFLRTKMLNMSRWLSVLAAMTLATSALAADAGAIPAEQRLRTFSSIAFNREAGDFYGLEVTFVPFTSGTHVLWRVASGRIQEPLLLEAIPQGGSKWSVRMPSNGDVPGKWMLTEKAQVLTAKAPTGVVERLRRRQ